MDPQLLIGPELVGELKLRAENILIHGVNPYHINNTVLIIMTLKEGHCPHFKLVGGEGGGV